VALPDLTRIIRAVGKGFFGVLERSVYIVAPVYRLFPSSHYVLLSILFSVGLELIFALQRWVIFVAITVVLVVIVGIILVRFEEKKRFMPTQIILPALAATGLSGFAFLLPTTPVLHVYIIVAGLMLFFILKHGTKQAYPIWSWVLSMVVYFLNVAFLMGLRFHLYVPVLLLLGFILLVSILMALQALRRTSESVLHVILPVLALALILTEVTWVLQFLPSHYFVQAGIITILYYVIFNLVSLSYTRRLVRRDIIEYAGIGLIALLIISVSAQWT
jgi:hypothetical protein